SGSSLDAILKVTMTEQERCLVCEPSDWTVDLLATAVFSAKETLYKALFPVVQSFFGFEAAEFVGVSDPGVLTLRLTKTLHASLAEGSMFNIRFTVEGDRVFTWLVQQGAQHGPTGASCEPSART
ncbi:MAG: 4'-phosphopantetheinyl transferase superfamily protein, partial [Epibacterium sp.]|nr:4'-phosphopantetheinyl transferase superfamily protein [Epibacterium sp.]NQX75258.1 4'-phosphopantetheinyl transferase superfamily protein [Epibacterium sp.]